MALLPGYFLIPLMMVAAFLFGSLWGLMPALLKLRMKANENYWEGAPRIKAVEVRPITEASTRFAALVSGQAQIVTGVPVELYEKVLTNPKLNIIRRRRKRMPVKRVFAHSFPFSPKSMLPLWANPL